MNIGQDVFEGAIEAVDEFPRAVSLLEARHARGSPR